MVLKIGIILVDLSKYWPICAEAVITLNKLSNLDEFEENTINSDN